MLIGATIGGLQGADQWRALAVAGLLTLAQAGSFGCLPGGPATPYRAYERLRGLTEEEVLACAGKPHDVRSQGPVRILSYERAPRGSSSSSPRHSGIHPITAGFVVRK